MTCLDAFKNVNIQVIDGALNISPCCLSPTEKADSVNFVNNAYLNRVRQSWNNEISPIECSACIRAESAGVNSRRIGTNKWYVDNGYDNNSVELIRVDYWTGDTCNLRCAICGPNNSSAWKQELNYPVDLKKSTINYFWKDLNLTKIKFVHFNGGEPLLSKEHIEFLHALPHKDQVYINYNTNGTILPNNELISVWEEFKLVQLDFSIDDIGERFEYQRYPAKWKDVTENLQWYINNSPVNCMFAVNTSIGLLNNSNINNLNNWLQENFSQNRLTDPIEHRTQLVTGLFSLDQPDFNKVIKFLEGCDARRGTNWQNVFPELLQYI